MRIFRQTFVMIRQTALTKVWLTQLAWGVGEGVGDGYWQASEGPSGADGRDDGEHHSRRRDGSECW